MAANQQGSGLTAAPLFTLITGCCLFVTLEFLIVGLLPLLVPSYNRSLEELGMLVSTFALSASLAGPVITFYLSRWSTSRALALCLAVAGFSTMLTAFSSSFEVAIGCRMIQGAVLTAYISIASSYAAFHAASGQQGRAVGQINLGVVVSLVVIIPLGLSLSPWLGWQNILLLLAVLCFVLVPITRHAIPIRHRVTMHTNVSNALLKPHFILHLLLSLLVFTSMFVSYSYISPWLLQLAGITTNRIGVALFIFALAGLAGNEFASRLVEKKPLQTTVYITLLLGLVLLLLSQYAAPSAPAFLLFVFWGVAHMAAFVACQVRVMAAAPDAPALAAALNISVCNLGIALGSFVGAKIIANYGLAALGPGFAATGLIALLLSAILACVQYQSSRATSP
ncbi:MFS transporter [Bowmanella denitrificans]|uniref:MFS transporter n=1 Tax=Bowmanella denitrificans TaxID=366582 RepID=UPI000C9BFA25|nr:MFS transporter [Bowmanella denitrificans]